MKLLVSMGLKPAAEVTVPLRPVLRCVDVATGAIERDLHRAVPPERSAGLNAHDELTAGEWAEPGVLLVASHSEVLWIDVARWVVLRSFSHPLMHDVHSVTPLADGAFMVVCTGNESVLRFSHGGELLSHHWMLGQGFDKAYGGVTDFRRVHQDAFKPHREHPNHAVWFQDEAWITCFETQRCVGLRSGRVIAFKEGQPHDGRFREGLWWFTTVTGHVLALDPKTRERVFHLDLNKVANTRKLLGWCRGVEVVGDRIFVGMTMLRATRHREVARMLIRGEEGVKLPTRVIEIHRGTRRIVREIEVGNAAGGTIYGINAWNP